MSRLLWSADGEVGCSTPGHAPHRGSDTWARSGWKPMTAAEVEAWTSSMGAPPSCEACDAKNAAVA